MADGTRVVLYAALAGNVLVAISKFVAVAFTHSSAMLSEAVHSLVDTSNELLLLYGANRAARPPDAEHPLGHGREVYFWSFVVSLLIFVFGACVSLFEGISHVRNPHPMEQPWINYVVLGAAALFEGGSWWFAFREFRSRKGARGYLQAAQETKDPSTLMVFAEDSAALVGIAFALAGTAASQWLGQPFYDGVASIAIGVLLAIVAAFLAHENKQLLIGENARPQLVASLERIATAESGIAHFNGLLTFQIAPRQVVVNMSLDFVPTLTAREVQETIERLERHVREEHQDIMLLLVKPQTPEAYQKAFKRRRAR
jgi:cation diffusion facilitator family transporter